jgi:hypothetical protein
VPLTRVPPSHWEAFASLILEAAYEATMWAAVLNAQRGAVASPNRLIADKAYDADSSRNWLKFRRIKAVIPSTATRTAALVAASEP